MKRVYASVFLVSLGALVLEVTLTRILSAMMWYHFSYLIISMALLGYGAAGARLAVSNRFRDRDPAKVISLYSALFSVAAVLGPFVATRIRFFDSVELIRRPEYWVVFLLFYIFLFAPFYFAGVVVGFALKEYREEINRLYFFDLSGAALGCLVVVGGIGFFGGPGSVTLASLFAAAASIIVKPNATTWYNRFRYALLFFLLLLTGWLALSSPTLIHLPKRTTVKGQSLEVSSARTIWNALNKVDVTPEVVFLPWFGADISPMSKLKLYRMRIIFQDGRAPTPMYRSSGDLSKLKFLKFSAPAAAYLGKSDPEVLIIGPGGGVDVMIALTRGASKITAVELNPSIYKIVTSEYSEYIGKLYENPKVKLINAEGRNFMARRKEKYDIIQITCVDTFSALSSGAYSLAESYLYTVEALETMLDNLKPDGVLAYSRHFFSPPRESLRLMATTMEALDRKGVEHSERHIFMLGNKINTMLLKKNGFTPEEADKLERVGKKVILTPIYHPYRKYPNEFSEYAHAGKKGREAFEGKYIYNISPVTDDSPYFFQYYKWSNLFGFKSGEGRTDLKFPVGHVILTASLVQVTLLSLLFILWPLRRISRGESGLSGKSMLLLCTYFAALGAGYMSIEIVLMQKLMVFLGYPLRSLTVVLFSLLISSGLGSAFCRRWEDPFKAVVIAVAAIAVLVPAELLLSEKVFHQLMGMSSSVRILATSAAIFPIGFFMGMPFPSGIRLVSSKTPKLIPWCWGINACFSVISSLLTVVVSMTVGFRVAMIIGVGVYISGLICLKAASIKNG